MIIHSENSIFGIAETESIDLLVNPANTVGVMGAGLALELKLRYPRYYEDYRKKAVKNQFQIGELYLYNEKNTDIATLFTKKHWKYPSQIEWVTAGLTALNRYLAERGPLNVAMPLVGAGKGGLDKETIINSIEKTMKKTTSTIYICHDRIASKQETTALNRIYQMTSHDVENHPLKNTLKSIRDNPIPNRFRDLIKINGVGKAAYPKLFLEFMYPPENRENTEEKGIQTTLF